LANNNTKDPETVTFRGKKYYLPAKSISILPDCKTVVYNTMTVIHDLFVSVDNCLEFRAIEVPPETD
jgi:hypothetical protein